MATDSKHVNSIVPLSGKNFATWKLQVKMLLMKEGLWSIVNGSEEIPAAAAAASGAEESGPRVKFLARRDRALANIVLSVDPSLLYLIGDPDDPVVVWNKLCSQFQKKSWVNKLELRRKLHSLRLKDGDSVSSHIKSMTEIFSDLSVIGAPLTAEDQVVHLLASLPDSFNMIVTALQANADVPEMDMVTERLLHEESKNNEKLSSELDQNALVVKPSASQSQTDRKIPTCYHCGKTGHIKKNCYDLKKIKERANNVKHRRRDSSSSSSSVGFIASHALNIRDGVSSNDWIADSGASSHMCNNKDYFDSLQKLPKVEHVMLGDNHVLDATHSGNVTLKLRLPDGSESRCNLKNVLYVPKLCYNLLSIYKVTDSGNKVVFSDNLCEIFSVKGKLACVCVKKSNLYFVKNCLNKSSDCCNVVNESNDKTVLWHQRFGHLGYQNLKKLSDDKLVDDFNLGKTNPLGVCEPCIEGKHHRSKFPIKKERSSHDVLQLVHSDVCGKINSKSLGGSEYFVTFIDDFSRFVWVYCLKTKDEVFSKFQEWKNEIENSTGKKLRIFRTDNGGEYVSRVFSEYLKKEGIVHEKTVPKNPEQNGVSERWNRTLVETTRCMLQGAKLPQKFWAEALSTAAYLKNRSPAKATQFKTPFEVLYGTKASVANLRTFGCTSYAHVPKDERRKLDSKAKKCIFLGYGKEIKGYRLFDISKNKVIHSRDVIFNESEFGMSVSDEAGEIKLNPLITYQEYLPEDDIELNEPDCQIPEEVEDEIPRRSVRERRPPNRYGEWVHAANHSEPDTPEPKSVSDALSSVHWKEAMQREIDSINQHEVWELVPMPANKKLIKCKWVFKEKIGADGSVQSHKARLVAQGFSQQHGLDYDETFSPVVKFESVRTIISMAAEKNFQLHQMDVTSAFLNGVLEEEVFLSQPVGFIKQGQENLVCRLKKSLYGLKQAPRCWNTSIDDHLKSMNFTQSVSDPCIYTKFDEDPLIIGVYVDDIIIAGNSDCNIQSVKNEIARKYSVKDLGPLHYFLGVNIVQDSDKVWIGQKTYSENVLKKFGMDNSKPISTPVDTSLKLLQASDDSQCVDQKLYQQAVGSLLYLSVKTRPDISYAVGNVARYCSRPTQQHWRAVTRILRYLKGTIDYGLHYVKHHPSKVVGYSDADWAGDINDRKSTSGYVFMKSDAAITWRSKKQTCVALSTAEAEYVALSSATQEAVWLRKLTSELSYSADEPTIIFEDNQSAIAISRNPQFHGRTKHIDIKYHYVRDQITQKSIDLVYCPTGEMIADLFTKGLAEIQFNKLRLMIGVRKL